MNVTSEQARQRLVSESQVIAFQAIYARMAGSITAGLMLAQMLFLAERVQPDENGDRWVYHSRGQWEADTTMTRWEQETARAKLRDAGFIREEARGRNNVIHFCLNYLAVFTAKISLLTSTRRENLQPLGGKTSNQCGGKPPTTRRENLQPSNREYLESKEPSPVAPRGGDSRRLTRRQRQASVGQWDGTPTPRHFPDDPRAQELSDRLASGGVIDFRESVYLQQAQAQARPQ